LLKNGVLPGSGSAGSSRFATLDSMEDLPLSPPPKAEPNQGQNEDERWMRCALEEARFAESEGEVPVGAVVVYEGRIVGRGRNRNRTDSDPSAHAEMVAMREAGRALKNHRLIGCQLFVTIEPCAMCAGAAVHARLQRLVYGAADPKAGAVSSVMQVLNHPALNHRMEVVAGILGARCAELLQKFFQGRRGRKAD
jgi:tRNA(adenine34) deaminase